MGFLSDMFDPGAKHRKRAGQFAKDAQFTGGNFSGPGGLSGGISFGKDGRGTITSSLGSFDPLMQSMFGLSGLGLNLANRGLDPKLLALGDETMAALGPSQIDRFANFGGMGAMNRLMMSSLGTATADPFALGASTADMLRQRGTRSTENAVAKQFDRMFASGGLANKAMREEVLGDFSRQLDEQDLGYELAGLNYGRQLQQDASGRVMAGFGGLEAAGGRNFAEQFQQAGFDATMAMQRFGVGSSLQEMMLNQLVTGANVGMGSASGAMDISKLPLAFLQANLGAQQVRSNAALGGAEVQTNLADMASSPLLGMIEAGGQLSSAIGGFGGIGSLMGDMFSFFKPKSGAFTPSSFGGFGAGYGGGMSAFGGGYGPLNMSHLLEGVGGGN